MTTHWSLVSLLSLAACASPGSVPEPRPEFFASRECEVEEFPAELPPASALVDAASLTRALQGAMETFLADSGSVSLTLWYKADGVNVRREVIGHTVTPAIADSVQALVFAALETPAERERAWGVRFDIGLGERVTYHVGWRQYCPPRPRDPELENAMERIVFFGPRSRSGVRERVVLLRVTVHPVGYVADAKVVRGAGSGGTLERDLADFIRQYSFEPARLDGVPTYGQIIVPVRVRY